MTRQRKQQAQTTQKPAPSQPALVKVGSPGELLGLVPYLLGFRPTESLVLMLVRQRRVLLTARIDLPPLTMAGAVVERFTRLADQHDASGLMLFGYSAEADATRRLLEILVDGLTACGLVDALFVGEHRWWSLMCTGGCCPVEGTFYELDSHPMAAEAVYAGLTAAPDRTSIEDTVAGPPADDVAALERLTHQVAGELRRRSTQQRCALISSLVLGLSEPRLLSDEDCARLAVLAADVTVRDVAWAMMSREQIDDHLDLWGQVVRRAVFPWEVPALCLLGMAAWISGNGALQNCCTDRALKIDPTYSLATLLADINDRALSPRLWDVMATELRQEGPSRAG